MLFRSRSARSQGATAGTGATKGRGITSPADGVPQGDNFDIDYVVHEIGHQLGGNEGFTIGFFEVTNS